MCAKVRILTEKAQFNSVNMDISIEIINFAR